MFGVPMRRLQQLLTAMLLALTLANSVGCPNKDRLDPDDDGYDLDEDCADEDASIHPGADELCDGVDNDCDGLVDDEDRLPVGTGVEAWPDFDQDGFGSDQDSRWFCTVPEDYTSVNRTDCNDDDPAVYPHAIERCNGEDDDCDGDDDDDPEGRWYEDEDEDGYGNDEGISSILCEEEDIQKGWVNDQRDCDDTDPNVHPGATEDDCLDPVDYNCDGSVGYADDDADGSAACEECDDSDAEEYPGATERCDGDDDD